MASTVFPGSLIRHYIYTAIQDCTSMAAGISNFNTRRNETEVVV